MDERMTVLDENDFYLVTVTNGDQTYKVGVAKVGVALVNWDAVMKKAIAAVSPWPKVNCNA